MVLKINQKYFRTVCFSGNKKFALKGQLHKIFYFPFFSHESTRFHGLKYAGNCGSEALEMQTSEKNCDCGIAEFWLLSYIPLKSCRVVIAAVLPSSCRNATAG
jgi:hypothetical protein